MLQTIEALLAGLDSSDVRYCHWKSNWSIDRTLAGETDVDLLVDRADAVAFRAVLQRLGFRPAIETGLRALPSVEHHHALDPSGAIAHVHAYYRVISGESLAKNYRFPVEEMLLGSLDRSGPIPVPSKGAELVVFVLRMAVKHTTPVELAFLLRDWKQVREEVAWLVTDDAVRVAAELLPQWVPSLDRAIFGSAVEALRAPAPLWRRVAVGYRVRRCLRGYARRSALGALATEVGRFTGIALRRLRGSTKKLTPGGGGAVIALVGSEATGKSTTLAAIEEWLGEHFTVRRIHAGKPPSTALTVAPNLLLPLLRVLVPEQRSTRVDARVMTDREPAAEGGVFPLLFGIRSVLLAHDRRKLLTRAYASSVNGTIVLVDRYPSAESGAPDSPQLGHFAQQTGRLRRWLQETEARLYRDIPAPDVVIHLTAPLDVTLERNRARSKTEPEDYVKLRHERSAALRFERTPVFRIDTGRPFDESIGEIKGIIWRVL